MPEYVEVSPAYGADYSKKADAIAAWNSGKDFRENSSGRYCSVRDFPRSAYRVIIRYGKGMKVTGV